MPGGKVPKGVAKFLEEREALTKQGKRATTRFLRDNTTKEVSEEHLATLEGKKTTYQPSDLQHASNPSAAIIVQDPKFPKWSAIDGTKCFLIGVPPHFKKINETYIYQPSILPCFYEWRHINTKGGRQLVKETEKSITFNDAFYDSNNNCTVLEFACFCEHMDAEAELEKYWLFPNNQSSLDSMRKQLMIGGFSRVLTLMGERVLTLMGEKKEKEKDDLCIYSLGYFLVGSSTSWPTLHHDASDEHDFFNVLVPVRMLAGSSPELLIRKEDGNDVLLKYEWHQALVLPSHVMHQTSSTAGEWLYPDDLRIMLCVAVGPESYLRKGKEDFEKVIEFVYPFFPSAGTVTAPESDAEKEKRLAEWKDSFGLDRKRKAI